MVLNGVGRTAQNQVTIVIRAVQNQLYVYCSVICTALRVIPPLLYYLSLSAVVLSPTFTLTHTSPECYSQSPQVYWLLDMLCKMVF